MAEGDGDGGDGDDGDGDGESGDGCCGGGKGGRRGVNILKGKDTGSGGQSVGLGFPNKRGFPPAA